MLPPLIVGRGPAPRHRPLRDRAPHRRAVRGLRLGLLATAQLFITELPRKWQQRRLPLRLHQPPPTRCNTAAAPRTATAVEAEMMPETKPKRTRRAAPKPEAPGPVVDAYRQPAAPQPTSAASLPVDPSDAMLDDILK